MEVNGVNNVNMKGNAAAHNEVDAKEVAQVSGASEKDIKAAHEAQASYGKADVAFNGKLPKLKYKKPKTEVIDINTEKGILDGYSGNQNPWNQGGESGGGLEDANIGNFDEAANELPKSKPLWD